MSALVVAGSSLTTSLARYSRSWGLWLLLLVAPVAARFWIPADNDRIVVIAVNGRAPVMTSAMLGVSLGIVTSTLLLPIAFLYLRSNATRRQPWQIEEATAASRTAISLGRFAADVAVLGVVLAAMTAAGWLIAWLITPVDGINLLQVTLGLWLIAAPALMGVAAVRMLSDSLRFSRGPLGELIFFVLWMAAIVAPASGAEKNVSFAGNMSDFAGFVRPLSYSLPAGHKGEFAFGAAPVHPGRIALDAEAGLLSNGYIASRFTWGGLAVLLAAAAGFIYMPHRPKPRRGNGKLAGLLGPGEPPPIDANAPAAPRSALPVLGLVAAEARLIAQGRLWLLLAVSAASSGLFLDYRRLTSPAVLLLLIFGLTAHAGRSEQRGLISLTATAVTPPIGRRLAFLAAGLGWMLALSFPAIGVAAVEGKMEPLLIAMVGGLGAALVAAIMAAWSRTAFAPRLVLLVLWYGYLSSA